MKEKLYQLRWNLFYKKYIQYVKYGFKKGLVNTYEDELIENLRHVYYGGIPASIIILSHKMCNQKCYDRAFLLTLGFNNNDDFRLICADINRIKFNLLNFDSNDEHYGNHCFVERTKSDGTKWIYDTTSGLVWQKELYWKIEQPKITEIYNKNQIVQSQDYIDIKNANIDNDKYIFTTLLPIIKSNTNSDTEMYYHKLLKEIEYYKQEINYNSICNEVDKDIKILTKI